MRAPRLEEGFHDESAVGVVGEKLVEAGGLAFEVVVELGRHRALEQGVVEGLHAARQHAVVVVRGLVEGLQRVEAVRRAELGVAHA